MFLSVELELGIGPRVLPVLRKCSATESHSETTEVSIVIQDGVGRDRNQIREGENGDSYSLTGGLDID